MSSGDGVRERVYKGLDASILTDDWKEKAKGRIAQEEGLVSLFTSFEFSSPEMKEHWYEKIDQAVEGVLSPFFGETLSPEDHGLVYQSISQAIRAS